MGVCLNLLVLILEWEKLLVFLRFQPWVEILVGGNKWLVLGLSTSPLANFVKGAVESKSAYDKRAFYITYSIFFIHFKFYFTVVAKWPNYRKYYNIYKTHKTTSKWIHLNTLKLHNQMYIENKKKSCTWIHTVKQMLYYMHDIAGMYCFYK